MTDDLTTLRARLGWSCQHIADRLGMSERQVLRWNANAPPAPDRVLDWLRRVIQVVDAVPVPPPPRQSGARMLESVREARE